MTTARRRRRPSVCEIWMRVTWTGAWAPFVCRVRCGAESKKCPFLPTRTLRINLNTFQTRYCKTSAPRVRPFTRVFQSGKTSEFANEVSKTHAVDVTWLLLLFLSFLRSVIDSMSQQSWQNSENWFRKKVQKSSWMVPLRKIPSTYFILHSWVCGVPFPLYLRDVAIWMAAPGLKDDAGINKRTYANIVPQIDNGRAACKF
jgi:hypothetical protein